MDRNVLKLTKGRNLVPFFLNPPIFIFYFLENLLIPFCFPHL
jgi:hypothetical protein